MSALNTHTYDGKIDKNQLLLLQNIDDISPEIKKDHAKQLLPLVQHKHFIQLILDNWNQPSNYDPTNDLKADELLYLCSKYKDNSDFIHLLDEQLSDFKTGSCSQGRTHRIFQLLLAFQ